VISLGARKVLVTDRFGTPGPGMMYLYDVSGEWCYWQYSQRHGTSHKQHGPSTKMAAGDEPAAHDHRWRERNRVG
jgi:hypothetical protein